MDSLLIDLFNNVIEGQLEAVESRVKQALEYDIDAEAILNQGLIAAMKEVGQRFEAGEFYVPEMLVAARAMQAGLEILKPKLIESGVKATGKIVIGTVQGDLHDIGKNLVAMMLEGSGFEVIDLGTDVAPERFAEAAREYKPDLIGISALLTTTMTNMRKTIEALQDAGVHEKVKVIIGGAPVTKAYAEEIGADGYAADASRAAKLAKNLAQGLERTST
jgi:5-methyltetrahydrofolate--homocysteine methyltransferase